MTGSQIEATLRVPAHPNPFYKVEGQTIVRTAALYALLVTYEFAVNYVLANYLSDRYGYFHMGYDHSRWETYFWVCILTPITALPSGTRLKSASQFLYPIFMTFIGLPTPIFLVSYVVPAIFWYFYGSLLFSYFLLALSTRIYFRPIPTPVGERGYVLLLAAILIFFAVVFVYGMTQNFHVVSFAKLYDVRYSDEASAPFIKRAANMYIFSFGGFFVSLALLFRKRVLALLFLAAYVICYGLVQYKTAALAPFWIVYMFLIFRYFNENSAIRFYLALTAPFWIALLLYFLFPSGRTLTGGNLPVFAYINLVMFRQYGVSPNALGLYYTFFKTHPVTYWSQISGINFFLHYPYGDHTVAIEMQREYGLGNYNASFLSTEAMESYGYQALPLASGALGFFFILLNTAARGIPPRMLALIMVMPCLMIDERPLGTSILTGGILFLVFYLAWMPRSWLPTSPALR